MVDPEPDMKRRRDLRLIAQPTLHLREKEMLLENRTLEIIFKL